MIKLLKLRKHLELGIVGSIFLLYPSSALASATLAPFDLPFCPAEADSKATEAKPRTLDSIKLEQGVTAEKSEAGSSNTTTQPSIQTSNPSPPNKALQAERKHITVPSTYEQAQNANCLPLVLMPSRNEAEQSRKLVLNSQRAQLAALWTSTIERSEDIQFVVKVLQPQTDQKHTVAKAMNLVGGALYNLGATVAPTPVRPGLKLIGASDLSSLFNQGNKGPQISVGETIVLYKTVRDIAENLVENYRSYRTVVAERDAAKLELEDLDKLSQSMISESQPSIIAQLAFTVKKARRDSVLCDERAELFRQKLIDLAGEEAVDKLDAQLDQERSALSDLIGRPDINPPMSVPKPETASLKEKK